MIAKGNTHDNGARLARYITTGKDGEFAELWELRGFALRDITEAFRSIHVTAQKGQCRQPFFHVQVRNPDGETLTRAQWKTAIDRIEHMIGLRDQPRAVAVHVDRKTGHEHVHAAWSRIDPETLSAKALPFFKLRLKQVSRELESDFGLTPVPSARKSSIKYAPKRHEEQQAIRLGVAINEVREAIKKSFENSDCGRSFQSALNARGLYLACGDRRDFIVVDREGGLHAVGKRILEMSAAEIRSRLADLAAKDLSTVDEVRAIIQRQTPDKMPNWGAIECPITPSTIGTPSDRLVTSKSSRKQRRAVGKKKWDCTPPVLEPASPPQARGLNEREPESSPHDVWLTKLNLEKSPTTTAEPSGPYPTVSILEPHIKTPPQSGSRLGELLKRQFKALVKVLTDREPQPRPKPRRRREEIGGCFKAAAANLFRQLAPICLDAVPIPWEPFAWLHVWEGSDLKGRDFQQEHSIQPPVVDQTLNL